MISVWRIATDTKSYVSDDLTGKGAEITGGRWNSPGTPVLYAADSISLACLETLVHLETEGLPLNRYLVRIDIPRSTWDKRETQTPGTITVGWDACPPGMISLNYGDKWLKSQSTAVMLVPSIVVPEEFVVLINPAHPDTKNITATKLRKWLYDPRLRDA